ncbi:MAG: hypothetical protein AB7H88_05060 [Vicinamibacterales bacterium]
MGRARRLTLVILVLAAVSPLLARQAAEAALFRVFLTDGTALTSYGEWARAGDRVVFSMPLTPDAGPSAIQLVSIPASRVDWARTDAYAEHARGAAYAATRGEADFATFSAEVADALNRVAQEPDPASRLRVAENARRALAGWPAAHFGYRAGEVREILGLLDEVISELRAAAGLGTFDLALSARTMPPPAAEPLLPAPSQAELVEQLMAASALAETPVARVSLLQTVVGLLDRAVDLLPGAWASRIRKTALGGIAEEARLDRVYADLRRDTLRDAQKAASRADVRSLQRLREKVVRRDRSLGTRRADEVNALLATVDAQLDAARRLRLARDQWQLRLPAYRAYEDGVAPTLEVLDAAAGALGDIKAMAGPDADRLVDVNERVLREQYRLSGIRPPEELSQVHALIRSAWSMAANATRLRLAAVRSGSLDEARQASAAAAGALMLTERAHSELAAALEPPRPD